MNYSSVATIVLWHYQHTVMHPYGRLILRGDQWQNRTGFANTFDATSKHIHCHVLELTQTPHQGRHVNRTVLPVFHLPEFEIFPTQK